jgi:hypothetical protein
MSQPPCIAVFVDDSMVNRVILENWPDGAPLPNIIAFHSDLGPNDDDEDRIHFFVGDEPVSAMGHDVAPEIYQTGHPNPSPQAMRTALIARKAAHERVRSSLAATLAGYLQGDPALRARMQTYSDWPRVAERELDRRNTRFLETLPDEALKAIAQGEIDLAELIGKIPG